MIKQITSALTLSLFLSEVFAQGSQTIVLTANCAQKKIVESTGIVKAQYTQSDVINIIADPVPTTCCANAEFLYETNLTNNTKVSYTSGTNIPLNGVAFFRLYYRCQSSDPLIPFDKITVTPSIPTVTLQGAKSAYYRKLNIAHFIFNEKGTLIGTAPVNIDADDKIIVSILVPKSEAPAYSIDVLGEYDPTDLNIRTGSIDNIKIESNTASSSVLTEVKQEFGPFTSDLITIKLMKGEAVFKTRNVKINPLYHVAIGASFVATTLEKPSFGIFPLDGTTENTIDTFNNGSRPIATFNVIFYWKPMIDWATRRLRGHSHITTGRDILKEATFWERLNPTFGVSIDKGWRENFFLGGNFEFARGGSITAGWHYGRISELADNKFVLGQTPFIGTKDDIKLSERWRSGTFIGITLDYRIFNTIFNRN